MGKYLAKIGKIVTFFDLNEADAYATSLGGAQINLLNNGVLYAGEYTISSDRDLAFGNGNTL